MAIDIDGTLANYHSHIHAFAQQWLGRPLREGFDGSCETHEWWGIDLEVYRDIKLAFRQGGMKRTMPLYDGASLFVSEVARQGAEIWITTTRPYNRLDNIDPDTREWLRRNGIPYDHMLYDEAKYRELCQQVEPERVVAVVEDLPTQYRMARDLGLHPIMPRRHHNAWWRHKDEEGRIALTAQTLWDAANIITNRLHQWREERA